MDNFSLIAALFQTTYWTINTGPVRNCKYVCVCVCASLITLNITLSRYSVYLLSFVKLAWIFRFYHRKIVQFFFSLMRFLEYSGWWTRMNKYTLIFSTQEWVSTKSDDIDTCRLNRRLFAYVFHSPFLGLLLIMYIFFLTPPNCLKQLCRIWI